VDGLHLSHLPAGTGTARFDTTYEWGGVTFTAHVWERAVDDGYHVDLQVIVLRGHALTDLTALRDFLARYHERDPAQWVLTGFRHDDGAGLIGEAEAFWLVEPGIAVEVRIAPERFDLADLQATALGTRLADQNGGNGPGPTAQSGLPGDA